MRVSWSFCPVLWAATPWTVGDGSGTMPLLTLLLECHLHSPLWCCTPYGKLLIAFLSCALGNMNDNWCQLLPQLMLLLMLLLAAPCFAALHAGNNYALHNGVTTSSMSSKPYNPVTQQGPLEALQVHCLLMMYPGRTSSSPCCCMPAHTEVNSCKAAHLQCCFFWECMTLLPSV